MLKQDDVRIFLKREREQGKHLQTALQGYHQKIFLYPPNEVKRLKRDHRWFLGAFNGHARAIWFRSLGGHICRYLGVRSGVWVPNRRVYFLTLIDEELAWGDDDQSLRNQLRETGQASTSVDRARERFARITADLNCLGMIDVACYVSSAGVLGRDFRGSHVYLPHFHGLVWGIRESDLEYRCAVMRTKMKTFFKYASSVQFKLVKPGDLAQVIWYTTKAPRKQYQLWCRGDGHVRQFKRNINGVNAVRLYAEMRDVTLDQLVVANRRGAELLVNAQQELRLATARAERTSNLPDSAWYQNRSPKIMPMKQIITLEQFLTIIDTGFSVGDETIIEGIPVSPLEFLNPEIDATPPPHPVLRDGKGPFAW
jgi:hypothetical protein